MKLSALRYLVAFADGGSISRAAENCGVSQPTLSVALKGLEDQLGVALIARHKGHAALTDIGEQVVAQARRALDETRRIEDIVQTGRDRLTGKLRLGVIHTIAPYLLPELIASMRVVSPAVQLFIEESMTALLAVALQSGAVDAAILALPFELPGVRVQPLYDEAFRVIVPRNHAWADRTAIKAGELRGADMLVLKAGNCFRDQVLEACPDISHAEGSLQEGHSIETVRCMVASGYGVSVLPKGALRGIYENDLVVSLPFEPPEPSRRVALAWRSDFNRPKAIEAIVEAVSRIDNCAYRYVN